MLNLYGYAFKRWFFVPGDRFVGFQCAFEIAADGILCHLAGLLNGFPESAYFGNSRNYNVVSTLICWFEYHRVVIYLHIRPSLAECNYSTVCSTHPSLGIPACREVAMSHLKPATCILNLATSSASHSRVPMQSGRGNLPRPVILNGVKNPFVLLASCLPPVACCLLTADYRLASRLLSPASDTSPERQIYIGQAVSSGKMLATWWLFSCTEFQDIEER